METKATPMDAFFTEDVVNNGIVFPLDRPDGTPTEHWLRLRGADSDAYKKAAAESNRRILEFSKDPEVNKKAAAFLAAERDRMVAETVMGWSFEMPCTLENVMMFFKKAPHLLPVINTLVANRQSFFSHSSTSSTPTPEPSSS